MRPKNSPETPPDETSPAAKKIKYDFDESATLTVREKDVLYWVARGKENAEIAEILTASPETIRKHVQNIRRKYESESRLAIIAKYWQRQLDERDREIERFKRERSGEL